MYGDGVYGNRFLDDLAWPILLLLGSKENVSESQSPVKRLSFPNAWFVILCMHAQVHTHTHTHKCRWVHSTLESSPPTTPVLVATACIRPCSQVPSPSSQSKRPPPPWSAMPGTAWLLSAITFFFFCTQALPCWVRHPKSRNIDSISTQRYSLSSKVDSNALSGTLLSTLHPAPASCPWLNYKATPSKTQRPRCWDKEKWLFSKSALDASEIVRDAYFS